MEKIRVGDWEFGVLFERSQWAGEDKTHIWQIGLHIEHLTPCEKKHRASWEEDHPGKKYPNYV